MNESIQFHIFYSSLTRGATKWYIELKVDSFNRFNALEMDFLIHFQSLIRYEIGIEILTYLHQDTSTHIFDHIHEWIWRYRLIKAQFPDQLLMDWFIESLFPPITKDVTMNMEVTEE